MVILDGDIFCYRAAFSQKDGTAEDAIQYLDDLIDEVLVETMEEAITPEFVVYLTGHGNFRDEIAYTQIYKGNRDGAPKPEHLSALRSRCIRKWGAVVSEGEEADDLIAIRATKSGPLSIVVSIDKDMLQIPCRHYHPVKKTWTTIGPWEGLVNFYKQVLTGDKDDNIKGLYKVGPKTAEKLLGSCQNEADLYETCVKEYGERDLDEDRVIENARLLWLRREEGQVWQPPTKRG